MTNLMIRWTAIAERRIIKRLLEIAFFSLALKNQSDINA
ncbi:hypothetical protein BD94_1868 [Elizabethkingia anophelis NUHP1]|uniref:Uncharacterized protein n=1 Tax=Elizabethkingia anophelis NUHP1 TaxID=1338011 RepID=A0A077EGF8_9FLAO|nr:hypothetical protein BD94_1868 [Elizabethkingia anophelis NUHP1]